MLYLLENMKIWPKRRISYVGKEMHRHNSLYWSMYAKKGNCCICIGINFGAFPGTRLLYLGTCITLSTPQICHIFGHEASDSAGWYPLFDVPSFSIPRRFFLTSPQVEKAVGEGGALPQSPMQPSFRSGALGAIET